MFTATHIFEPEPPYDFDESVSFAVYGRGRYAADSLADGVFSRALEVGGKTVALSVRSVGEVETPSIEVRLEGDLPSSDEESKVVGVATRLVGAQGSLIEFYDAIESDDPMAEFTGRFRGLGIAQSASPFEGLVLSILGQQISNEVARVLRDLLVDTLGEVISVNGVDYRAFPSPAAIAEAGIDKLREMKLSARKAEYISDIAESVASGSLDLNALADLPDETIVEELVKLRGVGPWTAHWLLIRAFDRPDGFPEGDLAVQRSLGVLYNGGERLAPDEAVALSARWRPYRSYLVTYMFAAARQGLIQGSRAAGP
jgi:DNA-3-methyladenine glycosylase II